MESIKIEQLIEKYLDAETTLKEEAVLQDYFVNSKVAPHLEEYRALFGYFAESKNERFTKTIQLNTKKTLTVSSQCLYFSNSCLNYCLTTKVI